jgi:hypothetical protein
MPPSSYPDDVQGAHQGKQNDEDDPRHNDKPVQNGLVEHKP